MTRVVLNETYEEMGMKLFDEYEKDSSYKGDWPSYLREHASPELLKYLDEIDDES